jgi:hypothetical protein
VSALIWLCLSARPDVLKADFESVVRRLLESATAASAGVASTSGFYRLAIDPVVGTAHERDMAGGPAPFDAIVELAGEGPGVHAAAAECCRSAGADVTAAVDTENSAVIAGIPYVISDGSGSAMNAFCIRPARGRTMQACQEYWIARHRKVVVEMTKPNASGVAASVKALASYTQFHAESRSSRELANAIGFVQADFMGVARSFTDTPEGINLRLRSEEVATIALADERTFIDHSRSSMALYGRLPDAPA